MSATGHRVIVVGGGMAGLKSAVYLARSGMSVTLLEKEASCGGLVRSFERDGFVPSLPSTPTKSRYLPFGTRISLPRTGRASW